MLKKAIGKLKSMLNKIYKRDSIIPNDKTVSPDSNSLSDLQESELNIFHKIQPYTMTSIERVKILLDAITYVTENNIQGDIVECGVWKGGSVMASILQLQALGEVRRLRLYDTFEGMSTPTEDDIDNKGRKAIDRLNREDKYNSNVWAYSTLNEVKENIYKVNSKDYKVDFIKGKVEDTLLEANNLPQEIAILRLDTDWYESTKAELNILYPKVVHGGIIVIDDYGHWKGCKKAVDEYIKENNLKVFLSRVDYTCRVFVKTDL